MRQFCQGKADVASSGQRAAQEIRSISTPTPLPTSPSTVVFSDLDGTLLDHDTYEWQAAEPALTALNVRGVPVVLISSKTRDEIDGYRDEMGLSHPVVAENGAFIDVPQGYFSDSIRLNERSAPRAELQQVLLTLRDAQGFDAVGFFELGTEGIVEHTGLAPGKARLANRRAASEPLLWRDTDAALERFGRAVGERGLRCVRGGRFVHLMGQTDKADAMGSLVKAYQQHFAADSLRTIALGDGPNDLGMLQAADVAVVIPGRHAHPMPLNDHPRVLRPEQAGPAGWSEAILSLFSNDDTEYEHVG